MWHILVDDLGHTTKKISSFLYSEVCPSLNKYILSVLSSWQRQPDEQNLSLEDKHFSWGDSGKTIEILKLLPEVTSFYAKIDLVGELMLGCLQTLNFSSISWAFEIPSAPKILAPSMIMSITKCAVCLESMNYINRNFEFHFTRPDLLCSCGQLHKYWHSWWKPKDKNVL